MAFACEIQYQTYFGVQLTGSTAYDWHCGEFDFTHNRIVYDLPIDVHRACNRQNLPHLDLVGRTDNPADPYSWYCVRP